MKREEKIMLAGLSLAALGSGYLLYRALKPKEGTRCYGIVIDSETTLPLEGVTVRLNTHSTTTDSAGLFELTVPPGSYSISFSKAGYGGVTMAITLSPGEVRDLGTIYLTPTPVATASIFGTVTDADTGYGIDVVLVEIGTWSTYTDATGYFEISGIDPGTYTVTFSKAGYETLTI